MEGVTKGRGYLQLSDVTHIPDPCGPGHLGGILFVPIANVNIIKSRDLNVPTCSIPCRYSQRPGEMVWQHWQPKRNPLCRDRMTSFEAFHSPQPILFRLRDVCKVGCVTHIESHSIQLQFQHIMHQGLICPGMRDHRD